MITLMIVDDQELMRDGLATILDLKQELSVVGVASDGREAYEMALEKKPDIVLMDIRMPGTNGVQGANLITSSLLDTKVLMLTTFSDTELILEALTEGAHGYLLKDMPTDSIVQAIMTVHSGGIVLPQALTAEIMSEMKRRQDLEKDIFPSQNVPEIIHDLTEREREVLKKLGEGLNNKEIAAQLYISEGTVKNHVSHLIGKLEVRDRTQAAIFAVRYGITTFTS
ncbi:response regulator transcription factor [Halobacillus litoralis]|uniref:response regulator n=1 Tax=Halobacillus litoralis TaxID=45668 RepID=UPI001CD2A602|nr:response regulator transcription factor [Halobacillus litoralis]MCA0970571.1 response regulator transcription factor [Halobacillus litoralis]